MGVSSRTKLKASRALRRLTPRHIAKTRATRQAMRHFADRAGLVYFGYANQHDDDHRLVRGHTVSHTHIDDYLCIGTIRGYDTTVLQRRDTIRVRQGQSHKYKDQRCHWLIATVDLHTERPLPHIYIGMKRTDPIYQASYSALQPLILGATARYLQAFLNKYNIYGAATRAIEIESIISPQAAEVIVSHFDKINIEIERNTVYLYTENERPTEAQIEKLVSNALWLAEVIDTAVQQNSPR